MLDLAGVYIVVTLIACTGLFYAIYVFTHRGHPDAALQRRIVISYLFLLITCILFGALYSQRGPFWMHYVAIGAIHQSCMLGIYIVSHIFQQTSNTRLWSRPRYVLGTAISMSILWLDHGRYLDGVTDDMALVVLHQQPWSFFLYQATNYLFLGVCSATIVLLYVREIQRYPRVEVTFALRRGLSLVGFGFGTLACAVAVLGMVAVKAGLQSGLQVLDLVVQLSQPLSLLAILLSMFLPQKLLELFVWPYRKVQQFYQQRELRYLRSLHALITQLVPMVVLPDAHALEQRFLIEILDARDLVLSYVERLPASPIEEAALLADLAQQQHSFQMLGPYKHPPLALRVDRAYVTQVAVALYQTPLVKPLVVQS